MINFFLIFDIIITLILATSFYSKRDSKKDYFDIVKITVVDNNTNEKLSGVYEKHSKTYTDLNGNIFIKRGDSIDLELISYRNIKTVVKKQDCIRMLEK
jgi:hypothetical protein